MSEDIKKPTGLIAAALAAGPLFPPPIPVPLLTPWRGYPMLPSCPYPGFGVILGGDFLNGATPETPAQPKPPQPK